MTDAVSDDGRWFTVRDGAGRAVTAAAARAALRTQRGRLGRVDVDVLSDEEWPEEARPAVRTAQQRLAAGGRRGTSLSLDPRADEELDLALTLAPFSIGCSAVDHGGRLVWEANDTGAGAAFRLTSAEEEVVRSAVVGAGGDPGDLVLLSAHHLGRKGFAYEVVGGTAPAAARWTPPAGWRAYERTVPVGSGPGLWAEASAAVLSWGVKTRSGFAVDPPLAPGRAARAGERSWLVARIGPLRVREPVQVVETVVTDRRVALAYGTLDGHPVAGEEAFVVHRDDDGTVHLTLRSLTRAGRGPWRALFPAVLVAQKVYRRRYLRSLV
ncbi:DUF1990 family protein [Isoptericola sp. NPDC057653]|uniref:DUF1990 family protein n=1 Tax=Isoptericola sp. NPDC057653 TaxID=3346195 RepID=UPI0036C5EC4B